MVREKIGRKEYGERTSPAKMTGEKMTRGRSAGEERKKEGVYPLLSNLLYKPKSRIKKLDAHFY